MQHLLRVLFWISILIFSLGCASNPPTPDYQKTAPAQGEVVPPKSYYTYRVLCDLGNDNYLVEVNSGSNFESTLMKLHRDELSKFRRVK